MDNNRNAYFLSLRVGDNVSLVDDGGNVVNGVVTFVGHVRSGYIFADFGHGVIRFSILALRVPNAANSFGARFGIPVRAVV